ncbi:MAG: hypothetical protein ACJZ82_01695 [Paracoccaceae bacterium]
MLNKMRHAVIISKPHHVIHALNLIKQRNLKDGIIFIITNSFYGAKDLFLKMAKLNDFGLKSVLLFEENRLKIYDIILQFELTDLITDSDVGFKHFFYLLKLRFRQPKVKIILFEEGWGPYYLKVEPKIKNILFNLFGIGANFGGCCFTNEIYLYDVDEYIKNFPKCSHKAVQYKLPMKEFMFKNLELINFLFPLNSEKFLSSPRKDHCKLYLTDKVVWASGLKDFHSQNVDLYIKYHPGFNGQIKSSEWKEFNRALPTEVILIKMLDLYKNIEVIHHFSSVKRYVQDKRIKYLDLGKTPH